MWLHVPKSALSLSSAEEEDSISPSSKRLAAGPALWCTSSGKPTQQPASWRGWRKRPWRKALCGTTLSPSTLKRGVERWISSLVDRPVRISPSPGSAPGSTAKSRASSGSTSASSKSPAPASFSGKMWAGPQAEIFSASSTLSRKKDSAARVSPFVLLTWEHPSSDSASSSWPTAVTSDSRSSARSTTTTGVMNPGESLTDKIRQWATPAASLINYDETPESFEARSARLVEQGTRPLGANLGQDAKKWSTPQARDPKGKPKGDFNQANLVRDAHQWQTPRASDPEKGSPNQSLKGKPSLTAQGVKRWPTAAASDYKGSAKVGQRRGQLSEAILKNGHQAPTTPTDGDESPPNSPSSPRLNPAFVEWLMNWPPGMSLPFPVKRTHSGRIA